MPEQDCLFCKIVNGDINADIVFENDSLVAFRDINPKAPTHVLLIPREHIATMNDLEDGHDTLAGELCLTSARTATADVTREVPEHSVALQVAGAA